MMPYWRLYYHIVWATKNRQPLIAPEIEEIIYPTIIQKARELGIFVYALNGVADHVHFVAAIPTRLAVGAVVGQLKGRASYSVNSQCEISFEWQTGYGINTFGEKNLDAVVAYVKQQKQHHATDSLNHKLEICLDDDNGPPPVSPGRAVYGPLCE